MTSSAPCPRIRSRFRRTLVVAGLLAASASAEAEAAQPAASPVRVLVLREHGVGSASAAQGYLDQLIAVVGKVNAWSTAEGQYHVDRKRAESYITATKPQFGLLTLGAFLAFERSHGLQALGKAVLTGGGGEQYYLISKTAKDPAECKGQALATTFGSDPAFVDRVVFAGERSLADFTVQAHSRPLQPLKAVIRDEAKCALVDDAQLAELGHMSDAAGVKPVWFSAKLPSFVIVAFPSADKAQAQRFKGTLADVCRGDGAPVCQAIGVTELQPIEAREVSGVLGAYHRKR